MKAKKGQCPPRSTNSRSGIEFELLLHYAFEPGPLPQGTVVRTSLRGMVHVKMDRHGRVVVFKPSDLRIIKPGKGR